MRLTVIGLAWLAYFGLHSVLANSGVKAWFSERWPSAMPSYRIAFNGLSTVLLVPILWLVYSTESSWLWQWSGGWAWLGNGLALLAILGFIVSTRSYDMDEFLGLRQFREHVRDERQEFTLSNFHRFVRHPWYSLSLVLIWTRNMNEPLLISGLAITLYFIVGSKLEERALLARYGETYRIYMTKVPGLLPSPWKFLSIEDAAVLMRRTG